MALNDENAICEHETLRQLNETLGPNRCPIEHPDTDTVRKEARTREFPDIRTLDELIQRRIKKAKLQPNNQLSAAEVSYSSLFKEILECEFLRKFSTPIFDYYSGASESVQHFLG